MDIIKLVGCVVSILAGVYVIVKLHTSRLEEQIKNEKEQREKDCKELKVDIDKLFETRVSKEVCQERCKK